MEEKRNYVVYSDVNYDEIERVVLMTEAQAKAINWFMDNFNVNGCVTLANDYDGEEL